MTARQVRARLAWRGKAGAEMTWIQQAPLNAQLEDARSAECLVESAVAIDLKDVLAERLSCKLTRFVCNLGGIHA